MTRTDNSSSYSQARSSLKEAQQNPPAPKKKRGCLKNMVVGCLGVLLGSISVIAIEIAGAASIISKISQSLLGSSSSSSPESEVAPGRDTFADRLWEFNHRKEEEEREKKEKKEEEERQEEVAAERERALNEAHDKLAEPSW
jgi:hypothetical protein